MNYEEKTLNKKLIYEGSIIKLEQHEVELPNGKRSNRDIIRHKGASAVVPITAEGKIIFVEQYRKPFEAVSYEIPAGKLDPGEDPEVCAARELEEETGYKAGSLTKILALHPWPAFADEVIHIYLARDLKPGQVHPDEDEFISAFELTPEEALKWIEEGRINDGKTVSGVLYALRHL